MTPTRPVLFAASALLAAALLAPAAGAQDEVTPQAWSLAAARGAFDLCRADAPDAANVAEHGEIWGWPTFVPYLEHPDGYRRDAGGESRRTYSAGDQNAYIELTIQSGEVTSAAPANVAYFRCNIATDQQVDGDLEAYFTDLYGPPASKTDQATVWLDGAAKGAAPDDDAAALKTIAATPAAEGVRIELTRERGLDRAKMTMFRNENAG